MWYGQLPPRHIVVQVKSTHLGAKYNRSESLLPKIRPSLLQPLTALIGCQSQLIIEQPDIRAVDHHVAHVLQHDGIRAIGKHPLHPEFSPTGESEMPHSQ